MITTLGLWQTVGLIVLTLSLTVILSRLVTLIVLVRTHLWSGENGSATCPSEENHLPTGLNGNGSSATKLNAPPPSIELGKPYLRTVSFAKSEPWDEADELLSSYSTGSTPGGVSYVLPARVEKRSRSKEVVRKARWAFGKHPKP